jgi:hypothetical protein
LRTEADHPVPQHHRLIAHPGRCDADHVLTIRRGGGLECHLRDDDAGTFDELTDIGAHRPADHRVLRHSRACRTGKQGQEHRADPQGPER